MENHKDLLEPMLETHFSRVQHSWAASNRLQLQYPTTRPTIRKACLPMVHTYLMPEYGFNQWKSRMESHRINLTGTFMTFWDFASEPWYTWYGNKRNSCPVTLSVVLQKQLDELDVELVRTAIGAQFNILAAAFFRAKLLQEPSCN
jgi:hypothetical protein